MLVGMQMRFQGDEYTMVVPHVLGPLAWHQLTIRVNIVLVLEVRHDSMEQMAEFGWLDMRFPRIPEVPYRTVRDRMFFFSQLNPFLWVAHAVHLTRLSSRQLPGRCAEDLSLSTLVNV
jgi:hypothetical protein